MIHKITSNLHWVPSYIAWGLKKMTRSFLSSTKPQHLFFSICDHYEPYWRNTSRKIAKQRISRWTTEYPKIAERYKDADGRCLKYSFFYPEEEYRYDDMEALSEICRIGLGEVEIHLHHDNDTPDNLRRTLIEYKKRLFNDHGLLSRNRHTDEISYGFIHGNWALDNSRPDGRRCGVNNEITILQETGCYADFTMPSAPDVTQTKKVNSIYYAIDNPSQPKSHDNGKEALVGTTQEGLLMVQGPLCLNFANRKFGVFPRIENSGLVARNPPTRERVRKWISCNIHVKGLAEWIFVKIYTHGAQEANMEMLFDHGCLEDMIRTLVQYSETSPNCKVHFLSAREMINVITAIENGQKNYSPTLRDYKFK